MTSAAVPVKKASSAMYTAVARDLVRVPRNAQIGTHTVWIERRVMPSSALVNSGVAILPSRMMNRFSPAPSAT